MSLCTCAFGPRCESGLCCVDETAITGVKDRRTGRIRARADWSVMRPLPIRHAAGGAGVRFYCDFCFRDLQNWLSRPLLGIDRPATASEDWRPGLVKHIELTRIENNRQRAATAPPQADLSEYEERRMRHLTPAQREQARFLRRKMREFREDRL